MLTKLLQPFIDLLHQLAGLLPLPWFTAIGAFVEELIAPIPSPLVMTLAGSLAAAAGQAAAAIFFLALVGAVGKTIGSYLIYLLADKGEDFILGRFGKFLGVSHREVEAIGKYLNRGWQDDIIMFLLRAIPIIPTAPVSIVSGLIKVKLRTFLVSSFLGTLVRNIFYLYLGYTGVGALESINSGLDNFESFGYVFLFALLGVGVVFIYYQRQRGNGLKIIEGISGRPTAKKTKNQAD